MGKGALGSHASDGGRPLNGPAKGYHLAKSRRTNLGSTSLAKPQSLSRTSISSRDRKQERRLNLAYPFGQADPPLEKTKQLLVYGFDLFLKREDPDRTSPGLPLFVSSNYTISLRAKPSDASQPYPLGRSRDEKLSQGLNKTVTRFSTDCASVFNDAPNLSEATKNKRSIFDPGIKTV